MSLNLKHIPCPAGGSCTAFQCIFGHGERDRPVGEDSASDEKKRARSEEDEAGDDRTSEFEGHANKKSKFCKESHTTAVVSKEDSIISDAMASKDDDVRVNQAETSKIVNKHPASKPEEPPSALQEGFAPCIQLSSVALPKPLPLSDIEIVACFRKLLKSYPTQETTSGSSNYKPKATASSVSLNKTSKTPSSSSKTIARTKSESLNPRLLKSAPASHEVRFTLLKMLHLEMERLNSAVEAMQLHSQPSLRLSSKELIKHALDVEEYTAVHHKAVYGNVMKQKIVSHKRMQPVDWQLVLQQRLSNSLTGRSSPSPSSKKGSTPEKGSSPDSKNAPSVSELQQRLANSLARRSSSNSSSKKELNPESISFSASTDAATVSDLQHLVGSIAKRSSPNSIPPQESNAEKASCPDSKNTPTVSELHGHQLSLLLERLYTPINALSSQGYVPAPIPHADQEVACQALGAAQGWEICARCSQRFQVFPGRRFEDGALTSGGECAHHPGRLVKSSKDQAKSFTCCDQPPGESVGCEISKCHVFKVTDHARLASLLDFEETPPNKNAIPQTAIAFDCEMGYTTFGMEVIRLTLTSFETSDVILDLLVQPLGEILDLNTRYSGVSAKHFAEAVPWASETQQAFWDAKHGVSSGLSHNSNSDFRPGPMKVSLQVARSLFFCLISPETPLIGHGLENDLNGMRMIHPVIIDTVLLFPHPLGLPYRQKLANLASIYLGKTIQQQNLTSETAGHDSTEDAMTAAELVEYKLDEVLKDLTLKGWKVKGGELLAPTTELATTRED